MTPKPPAIRPREATGSEATPRAMTGEAARSFAARWPAPPVVGDRHLPSYGRQVSSRWTVPVACVVCGERGVPVLHVPAGARHVLHGDDALVCWLPPLVASSLVTASPPRLRRAPESVSAVPGSIPAPVAAFRGRGGAGGPERAGSSDGRRAG